VPLATQQARAADRKAAVDGAEAHARDKAEIVRLRTHHEEELKTPPAWAPPELDYVKTSAANNAAYVAQRQRDAVQTVQHSIGTFVAPPAQRSVWWDLAELAISLGTAGIGTVVGKAIGKAVSAALIQAGPAVADTQSHLAEQIAKGVQKGLEHAAKAAFNAVEKSYDSTRERTHEQSPSTVSSDASIAFFEAQSKALTDAERANAEMINDRGFLLRPLLGMAPESAIAIMNGIDAALVDVAERANLEQLGATASQWVALKARLAAGAESLSGGIDVTKMPAPSHEVGNVAPRGTTGVIDLWVDIAGGTTRVRDARVLGVAQAVAEELVDTDLRRARLPMRFIVGWNEANPTIITMDEAARLRVGGDPHRLAAFDPDGRPLDSEAQAERAARAVVEAALARSLASWQVSITTNDHSKGA